MENLAVTTLALCRLQRAALCPGHIRVEEVLMRVGADPVMPLKGRATKILINTGFLLLGVVFLSTKITHMTGKGVQIVKINK